MEDKDFQKIVELRKRLLNLMAQIMNAHKTSGQLFTPDIKCEPYEEEWIAYSKVLTWTSELFFDDDKKPRRNHWMNQCHKLTQFLAIAENKIRQLTIRLEETQKEVDELKEPKPCAWTEKESYTETTWDTDCGHSFVLNEGIPSENDMKYCCYCGFQLVEIPLPNNIEEYEA